MKKVNIKTHIALLCNICGWMRIAKREEFDDIKAVYAKIECPHCNTDIEGSPEYYGDNGLIQETNFKKPKCGNKRRYKRRTL